MKHAALDAIMEEIHKDLYYFTKFGAHRVMVEDHFRRLQDAIAAALAAERADVKKEVKCRS